MKLSQNHYTADAVLIWCFDNRFWPAFEEFVKGEGYANFDPVFIAGGAKNIASPEEEQHREFILRQIELSVKLHRPKKIVLMNHSDCGAYGGLAHFENDPEKELAAHKVELKLAKEFLEMSPAAKGLPIETIFVDFDNIHRFSL